MRCICPFSPSNYPWIFLAVQFPLRRFVVKPPMWYVALRSVWRWLVSSAPSPWTRQPSKCVSSSPGFLERSLKIHSWTSASCLISNLRWYFYLQPWRPIFPHTCFSLVAHQVFCSMIFRRWQCGLVVYMLPKNPRTFWLVCKVHCNCVWFWL